MTHPYVVSGDNLRDAIIQALADLDVINATSGPYVASAGMAAGHQCALVVTGSKAHITIWRHGEAVLSEALQELGASIDWLTDRWQKDHGGESA